MSWFKLNAPMGTDYRVDPTDIVNTKKALHQLGYYKIPSHRGFDDWTDDAMFNGIRTFQKANGLKIDGFMRPEGPTEQAINKRLSRTQDTRSPINAGGLLSQFRQYMSPEFYAGGTDGFAASTKCCGTGTAACDDDIRY